MTYTIKRFGPESKFSRPIRAEALEGVIPLSTVHAVFEEVGVVTPRKRKLTLPLMAVWVIALHLFSEYSMGDVFEAMAGGLDLFRETEGPPLPRTSALIYRRQQLGARPMVALFRRICRPMATEETPGAFRFGLRLMALDGSKEAVPDTSTNARAFGKPSNQHGEGAYPQVQGVYLCECGTHAFVDAGFWPYGTGEYKGAYRLLRSVEAGMLVLMDRGLHSFRLLQGIRERGAHALSRLPQSVVFTRFQDLSDGSFLAYLTCQKTRERQVIRVVEYTLTDPALPGYGEVHRLATTLLDPREAPALEIAQTYHERWEIEGAFDEKATHQRGADRPLRSQTPVGVIQELYGVLLAHYVIRSLMHEAAMQSGSDPDRLSFVHALRVVRGAILCRSLLDPSFRTQWKDRVLEKIAQGKLPPRRCRSNPRVVKRQQSKFPVKRQEHRRLPKPTSSAFHLALALI